MSVCQGQGWDLSSNSDSDKQLQQVSFTLQLHPINFLGQSYPLQPDMLFGWRPKLPLMPIPLSYSNLYVDWLLTYIGSDRNYRLVYCGARPTNSVKVNQQYDYSWKSRDKYKLNVQVLKDTIETVGSITMRRSVPQGDSNYEFDSQFQSGNLDAVIRVKQHEFDCFMRSDSNTRGHCNWYYFSVTSKSPGTVKLNICNMSKKACLYSKGMKPYINDGKGWKQSGDNIAFVQRYCRYGFNIKHTQLHFSYTFDRANQKVFFAYGIPYTFTQLQSFVKEIKNEYPDFVESEILCETLGGVSLPLLTITDKSQAGMKQVVLVTARMHPGESVSSHVTEGFIRELLKNQPEILRNFQFRIVPMVNADGVILGNFRTSYSGKDLNRQFLNIDKRVYPQIQALNALARSLKNHYKSRFQYFFDFHGHSTKSNLFCYGPQHPKTSLYYLKSRALAKLLSQQDPLFSYRKSVFAINQHKKATNRANMLYKHRVPMSYTFELSNGQYEGDGGLQPLTLEDMRRAGRLVMQGFGKFVGMSEPIVYHPVKKSKRKNSMIPPIPEAKLQRAKSKPLKTREIAKLLQSCGDGKLEELFRKVKADKLEKQDQGGSDSEDEIEDLENDQLDKLHQQILNRQIQYNSNSEHQTTSVQAELPKVDLARQFPFRSTNKENQVEAKKVPSEAPLRRVYVRSVTAKLRRKQTPSQEKYQLAQKNFVWNL